MFNFSVLIKFPVLLFSKSTYRGSRFKICPRLHKIIAHEAIYQFTGPENI